MYKRIIYTIIITLFVPFVLYGQSKPKRDVSKDRSVVEGRQQEKAKKRAVQVAIQKKQRAKRNQYKLKTVESPRKASYLYVNQKTTLATAISYKSGNEKFNVTTDGKEWSVSFLPSWCRVSKQSDSFVLFYDANTSHNERSDWFEVSSDDQKVRIDLKQLGIPINIKSKFYYGSLVHNVYRNIAFEPNGEYLIIKATVGISGAKDLKCYIVALIEDENNNNIKASYGYSNYALNSGEVYAATDVTPTSDYEQKFIVDIHLPNNAMKLMKRKNKLRCRLYVYCGQTSQYISEANYTLYFRAKNKKGKITTKKP